MAAATPVAVPVAAADALVAGATAGVTDGARQHCIWRYMVHVYIARGGAWQVRPLHAAVPGRPLTLDPYTKRAVTHPDTPAAGARLCAAGQSPAAGDRTSPGGVRLYSAEVQARVPVRRLQAWCSSQERRRRSARRPLHGVDQTHNSHGQAEPGKKMDYVWGGVGQCCGVRVRCVCLCGCVWVCGKGGGQCLAGSACVRVSVCVCLCVAQCVGHRDTCAPRALRCPVIY